MMVHQMQFLLPSQVQNYEVRARTWRNGQARRLLKRTTKPKALLPPSNGCLLLPNSTMVSAWNVRGGFSKPSKGFATDWGHLIITRAPGTSQVARSEVRTRY